MNNYKPIRLELIVDNKVEYSKLHSEDELKKEIERLKNFVSRTGYIEYYELVVYKFWSLRRVPVRRQKLLEHKQIEAVLLLKNYSVHHVARKYEISLTTLKRYKEIHQKIYDES